jgi:hypothetical protein
MSGPLAHLEALERALVARAFPAMTGWWREQLTRFYTSGRRQFVLRVGRRGGKSSTLCRVAVLEALYGDHPVPPGDVGVVAIVSVSREQGTERLRTIRALLDALGVQHRPVDGGIELVGRPILFRVYTASIAGVVGFTCICAICDEVARWKDADTGANPAREVLASLRPTLAGQSNARIFLSSSPLGNLDSHAAAFDQGETEFQCVAFAQTWVARPGLTEPGTHELEPDPKIWSREYAAVPSDAITSALDPELVRAAFRPCPLGVPLSAPFMGFDSSMGRGDSTAWVLAQWGQPQVQDTDLYEHEELSPGVVVFTRGLGGLRRRKADAPPAPKPVLAVYNVGAITGRFADRGVTSDEVIERVATIARQEGVQHVLSDQYQGYALTSAFARHRLAYTPQVWSVDSKAEALLRLRTWLRDGTLAIEPGPEGEALVRELLQLQETIRPSGSIGLAARRGHDDRACSLLSVAMADSQGFMSGSPIRQSRGMVVHHPDGRTQTYGFQGGDLR